MVLDECLVGLDSHSLTRCPMRRSGKRAKQEGLSLIGVLLHCETRVRVWAFSSNWKECLMVEYVSANEAIFQLPRQFVSVQRLLRGTELQFTGTSGVWGLIGR